MVQIWTAAFLCALLLTVGVLKWYRPLSIALAVVTAALFLSTGIIGIASYRIAHSISKEAAVGGYLQDLNGNAISADVKTIPCHKNGDCVHADRYCDPYTVTDVESYLDSKGNAQTRLVYRTEYDSCPRATVEFVYTVTDSLGNEHMFGFHHLEAEPKQWRADIPLPADAPKGVPPLWQRALDSIKAENADSLSVTKEYENYILSSEETTWKASSAHVDRLREANLLPNHTAGRRDIYKIDKVNFVKLQRPIDHILWQDELGRFNARLGMEKQGDMHVVIIRASEVPKDIGPDRYAMALRAYWLNGLGKSALAKNGIMLVMAVDDAEKQVAWARASTGMPRGNEEMLQALQFRLQNQTFSLENLLGTTKARIQQEAGKKKPVFTSGNGLVPQIIMKDFPFKRSCMKCEDEGENGGYISLKDDIPISTKGIVWAIAIDIVIALLLWGLVLGLYTYFFEQALYNRIRHSILRK